MELHRFWISICLFALSISIHSVESEEKTQDRSWYSNLSVVLHHNGEVDPCGSTVMGSINDNFINSLETSVNKYQMETRLTNGLARLLKNDASMCGSGNDDVEDDDDEYYQLLYSHCDRGPDETPILLDHEELIETEIDTLPCRFHTREGLRIQTLEQLKRMVEMAPSQSCLNPEDGDRNAPKDCGDNDALEHSPEIHLYAVPAGRLFHFAPAFVGEIFKMDHLPRISDTSEPISLEVLSTSPKVFDILNIFSKEEADSVVKRALAETSPTYRIKRSTTSSATGVGSNMYNKRTSENGFDTSGAVATAIKERIFELLGHDEYLPTYTDGLQVLRYNLTTAYIPHMDYLRVSETSDFDYDSSGIGGNRYATVLLYMTDIPENGGGETVFSKIFPENGKRLRFGEALRELRQSGDAESAGIQRNSWEEKMVVDCRRHFSVKPYSGRAVLFYSQHPNGDEDLMSEHGGCPVLMGDKWAANLWVWNTPRRGNPGAPMRKSADGTPPAIDPNKLHAIFRNSGKDESMKDAQLYYDEAMFWGKLSPDGPPLSSGTYEGHRWNVRVDGKVVKSWVIGKERVQEFVI